MNKQLKLSTMGHVVLESEKKREREEGD